MARPKKMQSTSKTKETKETCSSCVSFGDATYTCWDTPHGKPSEPDSHCEKWLGRRNAK